MHDFAFDLAAQKPVRDLVVARGFYGPYSVEGRYVTIDKGRFAEMVQEELEKDRKETVDKRKRKQEGGRKGPPAG